eukprot:321396_1
MSTSYLQVRLVEAIGLANSHLADLDPYCKVFLNNVTHLSENKIFKSDAKKKSADPIFDCAASFEISPKDFDNGILTIDIYSCNKAKKTDVELGRASLPLSYFKRIKQFEGWIPVAHNVSKYGHTHIQSPIAIDESDKKKDKAVLSVDKNIDKEQTPEMQFLSDNQDINDKNNSKPGINVITESKIDTNESNNKQKILGMLAEEYMKSTEKKYNKSSDVSNDNNQNKSNINESGSNNKQKKLAMLTEEYMKRREDELILVNNETFTALEKPYLDDNEQKKEETKNDLESIGRRNRDSGRIFVVAYYLKIFKFVKMSNTEFKTRRVKNLKIKNKFSETIPINVFVSTFNT